MILRPLSTVVSSARGLVTLKPYSWRWVTQVGNHVGKMATIPVYKAVQ